MNILKAFSLLFTIISISSCATIYHVTSDFEKNVDFADFKSYNILNHDHGFPQGANPINKQRIERAIHQEIGQYLDKTEEPDLEVSWFVKVETVTDVDVYRSYYARWQVLPYMMVHQYTEGTLVIDVIDRSNNQVIWHGKTSDAVYKDMPKVEKKINRAVQAMVRQFAKDSGVALKKNDDIAKR